jgi:hypothetical protein
VKCKLILLAERSAQPGEEYSKFSTEGRQDCPSAPSFETTQQ